MSREIPWPRALGARPSWPMVLLVMVGLHLGLLAWVQSPAPPLGTAAVPQVRWLQAAVLSPPEPEPQADGARTPQPRLQAPPQPRRPPRPTTAPLERAPQPAPPPRNDTPVAEPQNPPIAPPADEAGPAAPPAATAPATPTASASDGAQPPARHAAPRDPGPPAAPARPADARQFGCDFPRPPYPRLARLNGDSGTAVVRLNLAASGRIAAAVLERGSGSAALDAAALASARAGQCAPGAGARLATVPFHFQLDP